MNENYQQLPPKGDHQASRLRFQYCAQQNLLKHAVPQSLGGLGDSFQDLTQAHFKLGRVCQDPGLLLSINAHLWGAVFPIMTYGSPAQHFIWLPELLSGQFVAGHAITEPETGSDTMALTTKATQSEQGFQLQGIKRFITNTPIADCLIVYAKLEGQLTAFILRKNDPGVEFTNRHPVVGCSTATMGDVILTDCLIPLDRQLGKTGSGQLILQTALELERAFIFAGITGIMEWQLDKAIQHSRQRKSLGKHLGQHQAISHKIAEMKCRLDTVQLWINECARLKDSQKRIALVSAQTKLIASEAFLQSSFDAVQIVGASGLEVNQPLATLVQDAMASRLFSGTSEIQKNIIAAILGVGEGYKR